MRAIRCNRYGPPESLAFYIYREPKKAKSITTKGTISAMAAHKAHFHTRQTTMNAITPSTSMVPATATP